MFLFRSAEDLIEATIASFEQMIARLEQGAEQCNQRAASARDSVVWYQEAAKRYDHHAERGASVAKKLRQLVA
jgi:exonuclease VII small subunit